MEARHIQAHDRAHGTNMNAADHHNPATFRFLDLPPEMRNLIYGELLTLPRRPNRQSPTACFGSCHPGILATCRQIYKEAAGLLACPANTEQPFNILIHADWETVPATPNGHSPTIKELRKTVQIHNHGVYKAKVIDFEHIPNGRLAYPSYLRQVKRLHIEVHVVGHREEYYYGAPMVGSAVFARSCIHTLVSFLMEGHSLQELKVKFTSAATHPDRGIAHPAILNPLQPLRRLRNIDVVDILGFVSGGSVSPGFWAPMIEEMRIKTDSHPVNLLNKMQEIYHLCDDLVMRDDDDDERKTEHKLLKILYRYIIWELHFDGYFEYRHEPKFWISKHLYWMKVRVVKMREQNKEASCDQEARRERSRSSARSYWEMLCDGAPVTSWVHPREAARARWVDWKQIKASCGS
ncbi:unnamed protein product [Zymoseptoria tritici ST99CH_3D1]|nr:unnamed protein product [Zymoseptoria tritici ST99CH_3D1]